MFSQKVSVAYLPGHQPEGASHGKARMRVPLIVALAGLLGYRCQGIDPSADRSRSFEAFFLPSRDAGEALMHARQQKGAQRAASLVAVARANAHTISVSIAAGRLLSMLLRLTDAVRASRALAAVTTALAGRAGADLQAGLVAGPSAAGTAGSAGMPGQMAPALLAGAVRTALRASPRLVDLLGTDKDGARGMLFGGAGPGDVAASSLSGRRLVGEATVEGAVGLAEQVALADGRALPQLMDVIDSEVQQLPGLLSEGGYGMVALDVARVALSSDDQAQAAQWVVACDGQMGQKGTLEPLVAGPEDDLGGAYGGAGPAAKVRRKDTVIQFLDEPRVPGWSDDHEDGGEGEGKGKGSSGGATQDPQADMLDGAQHESPSSAVGFLHTPRGPFAGRRLVGPSAVRDALGVVLGWRAEWRCFPRRLAQALGLLAQLWKRAHGEPSAASGVNPLPGAQAGGVASAVGSGGSGIDTVGDGGAEGAGGLGHPQLLAAVSLVRRCPGFWPAVAGLATYSHGDPGLREVAVQEVALAEAVRRAGPGGFSAGGVGGP